MALLQTFGSILTVINSSTLTQRGRDTNPAKFQTLLLFLKILHLFFFMYLIYILLLSSVLYLPCISFYFQNSWWEKRLMHLHFLVFEFCFSSNSSLILRHRHPPYCRPPCLLTEGDLVVSRIENYKPLMNWHTDLEAPLIPQERLRIGLPRQLQMLEVFLRGVGISGLSTKQY